MFSLKKLGIRQRWARIVIYSTVIVFGIIVPISLVLGPNVAPDSWERVKQTVLSRPAESPSPEEAALDKDNALSKAEGEDSPAGSGRKESSKVADKKATSGREALVTGGLGNVRASFDERYGKPKAEYGETSFMYQFEDKGTLVAEFAPDVTDISRAWELTIALDKPADLAQAQKMAATMIPEGSAPGKSYEVSSFREIQPYDNELLGRLIPEDLFLGVEETVPKGRFEVGYLYDINPADISEIRIATGQIHY